MKILLVDDEREEREGISWLIKKYKYPFRNRASSKWKRGIAMY